MKKLQAANGMEIAYEDLGESRPGQRPFVMVHGFTGHRDDFEEVVEELAAERRVIVADLRGHGDSSRCAPDAYHFAGLIDDLVALLDGLGIERCDLLGHSMGGMLVLRFVLLHPERVASLVLMNTSPNAPDGIGGPGFDRAIAFARDQGMEALQQRAEEAGRKAADPILERWRERYWAHHRTRYLAMDAEAFGGFGRAMVDQESLVDRLIEIRSPTLILVGEADNDFLDGAELFERGISEATRMTIPEAGHHPHQENPRIWLDALVHHLRTHE